MPFCARHLPWKSFLRAYLFMLSSYKEVRLQFLKMPSLL